MSDQNGHTNENEEPQEERKTIKHEMYSPEFHILVESDEPEIMALSSTEFMARVIVELIESAYGTMGLSQNEPDALDLYEEKEIFTVTVLKALAGIHAVEIAQDDEVVSGQMRVRDLILKIMEWSDDNAENHDRPIGLNMSVKELLEEMYGEDEDDEAVDDGEWEK